MTYGVRSIAYYLPQFHPIAENDEWWGRGFTEWTNTAKARQLFPEHYQPHVPADLGFYDLRNPESRQAQADMAHQFGLEGFCYYHYWFGNGRRLLERPFNEVLRSGTPDFPFCLCWANESWTGIWHGAPRSVLVEQTYPGHKDIEDHFRAVLPAFQDSRYITVDGKPLFLIYSPTSLPDPLAFTAAWRTLAAKAGLPGIYFVGVDNEPWDPVENGFDGATPRVLHRSYQLDGGSWSARIKYHYRRLMKRPERLYKYAEAIQHFVPNECQKSNKYPCAIPNWDNTPRSGLRGLVLHGSTPELFRAHLRDVLDQVRHKPAEHRIVFIKSWNEWAEGNHLEPDLKFGLKYLEVLKEECATFARASKEDESTNNLVMPT